MKPSFRIPAYLLLAVFLLSAYHVSAQEEEFLNKVKPGKNLSDQLPPLDTLIKMAVEYHPSVKVNDELVNSAKQRVSVENNAWLNWISPYGNYSFGNQTIITAGSTPSDLGRISNGYRFGVNVGLPIGDILSRKNRKALQLHELKATEYKREEVKLIISEYVISAYSILLYNHRMLSIRFEMMEKARFNVQLAESEFKINNTTASAYIAINQIYTGAISEYENVRKDFMESAQKLELLLGRKLKYLVQ
ncbi:MAG: TolC family protein [Lacibacter sp.]